MLCPFCFFLASFHFPFHVSSIAFNPVKLPPAARPTMHETNIRSKTGPAA